MSYSYIEEKLRDGGIVVLDGGTGTELERRGVAMDPGAWCGPASLENANVLEEIHRDYISAGADIITANTYASSRLMLNESGFSNQFEEINRAAVRAAMNAREKCGREGIMVAGSLSHMCPQHKDPTHPNPQKVPSESEMADAFMEMASLLRDEGCDLILLEMMFDPKRMPLVFQAAKETGLPVWAGFSARSGGDGQIISYLPDQEIPFADILQVLDDFDVQAAGIMHTPSHLTGDALDTLRGVYDGPLTAYPDSGYFKMPHWQFEEIIAVDDFLEFAKSWVASGVQVVGGCCGLSPEHVRVLGKLKAQD